MTVEITTTEANQSRETEARSFRKQKTIHLILRGSSAEEDILSAAQEWFSDSPYAEDYSLREVILSPVFVDAHLDDAGQPTEGDQGLWTAVLVLIIDEEYLRLALDSSGTEMHIVGSLEVMGTYTQAGYTPKNYANAIGWDGKEAKGCDIRVPNVRLILTHHRLKSTFAPSLQKTLAALIGCVNDWEVALPINDPPGLVVFNAGELLVENISASPDPDSDWIDAQFVFAYSPNKGTFVYNPDQVEAQRITVTGGKKGWEIIDVFTVDNLDPSNGGFIPDPAQLTIHRVFAEVDFSLFNLPEA